jgi:serine phosphatase RsbU (regulator of sigma subunit)
MLLNEVQKQYHRAETEAKVIVQQADQLDSQKQQIESLREQNSEIQRRLTALESLVETSLKIERAAAVPAQAVGGAH